MVFANTVTDANICTEVSTSKRTEKKPEVRANNHIAPGTLLHKNKEAKIQIAKTQNTGLVSRC